jgi:O-antigen/teichoic acid export membrane protein
MQKRSISKNTFYLLIGNLGGTGLAFLLSLLIGRGLGVEALGVYSAVLAWVFSLSMLVDFGLSSLFTRDLAQNPDKIPSYLQTGIRQRWLFGGLTTAFLLLAASFLSDNPAVVLGLRISAPLLLIENLFGLYTAIFRAKERMFPIAALNIGMLLVQLVLSLLLLSQGIVVLLVVNMLTSLGRLAIGWFLSSREKSSETVALKSLLKRAWPFALAGLLAVAQQRMGILMLERLSSLEEVGNYAAVSRFMEAGRIIPNAFFGALFPALASLAANAENLNRYFLRVIAGLTAYGAILAIIGFFLATPLLSLSYGDSFLAAELSLKLGLFALLPSLLRSGRTLYCYAKGRERFVNTVSIITLILQFALSLWLIPILGALGLVIALLLAEMLGILLLYLPQNGVK